MNTNTECAFNKNSGCSALHREDCEGCTFFKTQEQLSAGRAKAAEMIAALPEGKQMYFRAKYNSYDNARTRRRAEKLAAEREADDDPEDSV